MNAFRSPARLLPFEPKSLVTQARDAVVNAAVTGMILPGDRLVEAELAKELGISRVPVREALRLLESQGLVQNEPYKGMRLMPVSTRDCQERFAVYRAFVTEALCALERAPPPPEQFRQMREVTETARHAVSRGALGELSDTTKAYFEQLFEIAGNRVIVGLIRILHLQFAVYFRLFSSDVSLIDHQRHLEQALGCLEAGNIAAAREALMQYLDLQQIGDIEAALAAAQECRRGR